MLRLEDIYEGLVQPWLLDRRDVNSSHGSIWDDHLRADYWVSCDSGHTCFAPLLSADNGRPCAFAEQGQFHREVGGVWRSCERSPGNAGGFHCGVVDTGQAMTTWTLVAKLADFGLVLGREAGLRVEMAALVRDDCEALVGSNGPNDECRSLFLVDRFLLPTGRVLIADAADAGEDNIDGPSVPAGIGSGYFPVLLSRDQFGQVCRISVVFHPSRARKVCRTFPPGLEMEHSEAEVFSDSEGLLA